VLQDAKIDLNVMRSKLRADEAWNRVLRNKLQQQVFISDEEVDEELKRLKAVQHLPRHHVAEIFLPVDNPDNEQQVREVADRLMQQIRNGANFSALAREFSQSASAAVGGDLGWVTKGQIDPQLERILESMGKGQVAGPTQTLAGFHILLLIDRVVPSAQGGSDALPSTDEIRNRLGNDRFNLLVRRYMRDLRQTAFVDIRG